MSLSSEVVNALTSHGEGRWFESSCRGGPSQTPVEMGAQQLLELGEGQVVRRE